jgi:hypothetical protein
MMPNTKLSQSESSRSNLISDILNSKSLPTFAVCSLLFLCLIGCKNSFFGSDDEVVIDKDYEFEKPDSVLVGDHASAYGMTPFVVEGVGLVVGLHGTGSDPAPSSYREVLLDEMRKRDVRNPNRLLASKDTAIVLVKGFLRPGTRKGDRFDVQLIIPGRDTTTSLRGGYLMETRLTEHANLGNALRAGHLRALAKGPIMIDPKPSGSEGEADLTKGRVLSGGVNLKPRPLSLILKPEHRSVQSSAKVGAAINQRFDLLTPAGTKQGVADPKTDRLIELQPHPQYKNNVERYLRVVRAIPLRTSSTKRAERLKILEEQLLEPITASRAAIKLEALGTPEAVTILNKGLTSSSLEVRFYSAEAVAYLGKSKARESFTLAAKVLAEVSKEEPAFRVFALNALSAIGNVNAYDHLRNLMDVASSETRYGAFRAIWTMDPLDPFVAGEKLSNESFTLHPVETLGPSMVHVTRSLRPEVVVFDPEQIFITPLIIHAGPHISVVSHGGSEISVSKYSVDGPDQKRIITNRVVDVVRAIAEVGGYYPDVVQALQEADQKNKLSGKFLVDALPQGGRQYTRVASNRASEDTQDTEEIPDASLADTSTEDGLPDKDLESEKEEKGESTSFLPKFLRFGD